MAELEQTLSHSEYLDWKHLFRIDPWGEYRADFRHALLAAVVASTGSGKPQNPSDFLPQFGPEEPEDEDALWDRWDAALDRAAAQAEKAEAGA